MVMGNQPVLSKPSDSIPVDNPDPQSSTSGLENVLPKAKNEIDQGMSSDIPMKTDDALKLPEPQDGRGNQATVGKADATAQFSSIDELLGKEGLVKNNTAPILMPTDLLFEYDSAILKPEAAATLSKLGTLIKKNAQALFRIEGHTDSFGTDEYNLQLSLKRADAVKVWLTGMMGLDSARISTVGLGKSHLLVPATGTVEQQQLNRRVEIVISVPK
jgi:outer membrane protein OmpA-like peptidoglycan-associated protein